MTLTEFYPTPEDLAKKMMEGVDTNIRGMTVLEPSAGKGDLAKVLLEKFKGKRPYWHDEQMPDVDVIEVEPYLRHILKGEGLRVVHDDFLSYATQKRYDLILMNPPFSEGDKHLLKALSLVQSGGQVVCLLNAETLRNPFTNTRKDLVRQLEDLEAEVEYIKAGFSSAERKTDVEVALIKLYRPRDDHQESIILDTLEKAEKTTVNPEKIDDLVSGDPVTAMVERYNFEAKAGVRLIDEYFALRPFLDDSLTPEIYPGSGKQERPILQLGLQHDNYSSLKTATEMANGFLRQLRQKYWRGLFASEQFCGLMTSAIREEFMSSLGKMADCEFSIFNILELKHELSLRLGAGVENSILSLFDELSYQRSYYDGSKNIHYYNGWKTNAAFKINRRVILPLSGFRGGGSYYSPKLNKLYRNCARKPLPSLPGFSRGMNGACVAKCVAV